MDLRYGAQEVSTRADHQGQNPVMAPLLDLTR
jgi:hypothetical protein